MSKALTDDEIQDALATCAEEPVHIPGIVQPFACLIATNAETDLIQYASENATEYLALTADELIGKSGPDILGRDVWHAVRGAASRKSIAERGESADEHEINNRLCALRVHRSGDHNVIEIEPAVETGMSGGNALKTLTYLMSQIQNCTNEQELFDVTCELMQHLTGYDRVLIYRFDADYNGEVLSEVKYGPIDSMMGLRFPHWDIPSQARDIMRKLPLRFIQDVDQTGIPILGAAGSGPLDITLADSRGVSPVHMEYLRNMKVAATMTLSVVLEGKLWGIISFHHRRPKYPPPGLRDVLISFLDVYNGKLLALRQSDALQRVKMLDRGFVANEDGNTSIDALLPDSASKIMEAMGADGLAAIMNDTVVNEGDVPGREVIEALTRDGLSSDNVIATDTLAKRYPDLAGQLGKTAGALVVPILPYRAVCLFRNEIQQELSWAGNPKKTIEKVGDRLRLSPRGSFSIYLEQVKGRSAPWSDNEMYLIGHLRTLLHAAERQTMIETLSRQQALMIGELNHRVRNILALVRSVSSQARRRYGSLNSYANAIENRIRALAAAHDLSGGRSTVSSPVHHLVQHEFEPYGIATKGQTKVTGPNFHMRPEVAPILSLVLHELTTNAAKYGALSEPTGQVSVTFAEGEDGRLMIEWEETGGPKVVPPNDHGFGMAMIQQAVPHELEGEVETDFLPEGFRARFSLPARHFMEPGPEVSMRPVLPEVDSTEIILPASSLGGTVMVLEDAFIIAKEMADQLKDLGFNDVRICASLDIALELIAHEEISLAILDVNLSAFGEDQTSESVANALVKAGVPFFFATGYGSDTGLAAKFEGVVKLTKPIANDELRKAIASLG